MKLRVDTDEIIRDTVHRLGLYSFARRLRSKFRRQEFKDELAVAEPLIRHFLHEDSNCVDVGCHEGDVMDLFVMYAPRGKHYGFEPLEGHARRLRSRYKNSNVVIHNLALANYCGRDEFIVDAHNKGYSHLATAEEDVRAGYSATNVRVDKLDNLVRNRVDFLKIDVEGAELQVLDGSRSLFTNWTPVTIFEHSLNSSQRYKTAPELIFNFFQSFNMSVFPLGEIQSFHNPLTIEEFRHLHQRDLCWNYIAVPPSSVA